MDQNLRQALQSVRFLLYTNAAPEKNNYIIIYKSIKYF
jgi:hypothetical protein